MRSVRGHGWGLAIVSAVASIVLSPTAALAHSSSVDSDPKDDASVRVLPRVATVTFNEPVSDAAMALTEPGGHVVKVGSSINGTVVTATLPTTGPRGAYVLAYRVVSEDGHPVAGEVEFTVTTGKAPHPQAPSPDRTSSTNSWAVGFPVWGVIGAAAVLLLAAIVLVRSARR